MDKGIQDSYQRGQQIARDRAVREIRAAAGRSRCKCARETLERLADKVEAQELKTLADGAGQGSPEEKEGEAMTDEQIKRLRELCDKATPGPWEAKEPAFMPGVKARVFGPGYAPKHDGKECLPLADAAFIAASRSAVPELLDALERSERIASNLDAVNKAIYRSMSEICGVAVDGFSDIQPVLMGLRVDADLFYSIKAENAALRAALAKAGEK